VRRGLDLFGITVLAAVTAIGGGTLRDVLLGRHPVFWIRNPVYLYVILAATLIAILGQSLLTNIETPLLIADAIGLGLFALAARECGSGRPCAHRDRAHGNHDRRGRRVVRDILSGVVPLLLRRDIYATAAIAGICLYLVMQAVGIKRRWAFVIAILSVCPASAAIRFNWQLPVFATEHS